MSIIFGNNIAVDPHNYEKNEQSLIWLLILNYGNDIAVGTNNL